MVCAHLESADPASQAHNSGACRAGEQDGDALAASSFLRLLGDEREPLSQGGTDTCCPCREATRGLESDLLSV